MNIAILLSGGTGTRLGADLPKQYLRVADQMIITYSLKTLVEHSKIDGIVIVAEEEWKDAVLSDLAAVSHSANHSLFCLHKCNESGTKMISETDLSLELLYLEQGKQCIKKKIGFAVPGATRQFSILNALHYIKYEWKCETAATNILIHDAARPNLSSDMVSQCMDVLNRHEGVMPVLPMKDTIYESKDGAMITNLLDRSRLFAGQAPEGFRFGLYYEANKKLLPDSLRQINGATEPAILIGMDVAMIQGDENNYKITTQADLERFKQSMERNNR